MKPANILIVEDKALIAKNIETILLKAGYAVFGKVSSGEDALTLLEKNQPDIILMDIHLAGKFDGIQTTELLNRMHNIPVIYLTDFHDKKTIDRAKPTRPAAYLVKPFKEKDLLISIELAFYNASEGKEAIPGAKDMIPEPAFPLKDRIFIKQNDTLQRIDIAEILWIEADRSYYDIKTKAQSIKMVGNLNVVGRKFMHPLLCRVHRSYIVNLDKITRIRGNRLIIGEAGNAEIPIGESYREELSKRIQLL